MKSIFKVLLCVCALSVLLVVVLMNFSSTVTAYKCPGTFALPEGPVAGDIYVHLEEYRPWVGLWSDTDGNMKIEVRKADQATFDYLSRVDDNGINLLIFKGQKAAGMFSRLSNILSINTTWGVFDGMCTKT